MNMKYKVYLIALLGLALLSLGSCRSSKSAAGHKESTTGQSTEKDLRAYLGNICSQYGDWTDVSMPVKIELQAPKRFSVSGKASMVRGKSLDFSLRFLGMEVASLKADRDSVYVLYKLEKIAFAESIARISEAYGFDLEDLQCLLLGRMFVPGKGQAQVSAAASFLCSLASDGAKWYAEPKKQTRGAHWQYVCSLPQNGNKAEVTGIEVNASAGGRFDATYGNFAATEVGPVAEDVEVSGSLRSQKIRLALHWNTGRASWNKGIAPTSGSIPKGYKRISIDQLNKALKSL